MGGTEEQKQGLEVDIDLRMADVWALVFEPGNPLGEAVGEDETLRAALGAFLRCAYGKGYTDALHEETAGRRGELPASHGYRVP